MSERELERLQEAIGHRFSETGHLLDALTHRSFVNEKPKLARRHNERLEFLGDAVLDLAASTLLFERFPDAREGEMTRRRADIVCSRALAEMAETLELGPQLRLGNGEIKTGGREKPRLLAGAVEAIIAAVYLDAGLDDAMSVARRLLSPHIHTAEPGALDFKSRLQEHLQRDGSPPPEYRLANRKGPDHDQTFAVEVKLDGSTLGRGVGRSKLLAEQAAAEAALATLESGSA